MLETARCILAGPWFPLQSEDWVAVSSAPFPSKALPTPSQVVLELWHINPQEKVNEYILKLYGKILCVCMSMDFSRKTAIAFIKLPKNICKKFKNLCTRISPAPRGGKAI